MASSDASSFPKQGEVKNVPLVQARPVATPMNARRGSSPARTRFNSDARRPAVAAVPAPTGRQHPMIVHSFSAQSLPSWTPTSAPPTAMCRSRSFTGEVVVSTPRMVACRQTARGADAGSWVPPPMPAVTAAVCCVPPPTGPPPMSFAPFPFPVQPQASYVPPPPLMPTNASYTPQPGDRNQKKHRTDTEIVIGSHRFQCTGVLGRGSFGEVWSAEELGRQDRLEVALKDIQCGAQTDMQQTLFEVTLLQMFAAAAEGAPPQLRIPRYISHQVDAHKDGKGGNRIRMAMTRVPGEPLDSFLKQPPPPGQDVQSSVRRGCMLAMALIKQIGPSLELISQKAIHRDVNAHNVLLSDAVAGGPFRCNVDPEEAAARASFWLIDFGLAVDSTTWHTAWRHSDIGGDCRYWPQSSWFVSFWGADEIAAKKDLYSQYLNRLDTFGLGITALELLCTVALDGSNAAGCCKNGSADGLRGSWRRLLTAWTKYWTDVTRWHTMIYRVFSAGGDVGPLYQELAKERVVDKILTRMAQIRQCLRDCVRRTEDSRIQKLLEVLANMLDESSSFGLRDAVECLGGECPKALLRQPSNVSSLPSRSTTGTNLMQPTASRPEITMHVANTHGGAAHVKGQGMVKQTAGSCGAINNTNSFVPPHLNSNSFVPPVVVNNSFVPADVPQPTMVAQVPVAQLAQAPSNFCMPPSANNSYVPPVHPSQGSYVPPAHLSGNGSYVPPPMRFPDAKVGVDLMAQKGNSIQGARAWAFRPRVGGA